MFEAAAKLLRVARLTIGLRLVELGALVSGASGEPAPKPNSILGAGLTIGPVAQEMIDRGQRPPRTRPEPAVRVPLQGSAEERLQRATAQRRAGG